MAHRQGTNGIFKKSCWLKYNNVQANNDHHRANGAQYKIDFMYVQISHATMLFCHDFLYHCFNVKTQLGPISTRVYSVLSWLLFFVRFYLDVSGTVQSKIQFNNTDSAWILDKRCYIDIIYVPLRRFYSNFKAIVKQLDIKPVHVRTHMLWNFCNLGKPVAEISVYYGILNCICSLLIYLSVAWFGCRCVNTKIASDMIRSSGYSEVRAMKLW